MPPFLSQRGARALAICARGLAGVPRERGRRKKSRREGWLAARPPRSTPAAGCGGKNRRDSARSAGAMPVLLGALYLCGDRARAATRTVQRHQVAEMPTFQSRYQCHRMAHRRKAIWRSSVCARQLPAQIRDLLLLVGDLQVCSEKCRRNCSTSRHRRSFSRRNASFDQRWTPVGARS